LNKNGKNNRKITVTAAVTKAESEYIRDFCAQFDMRMGDLVRELVIWAIDHVPIKNETPILMLEEDRIPFRHEDRNLRGVRPGSRRGGRA